MIDRDPSHVRRKLRGTSSKADEDEADESETDEKDEQSGTREWYFEVNPDPREEFDSTLDQKTLLTALGYDFFWTALHAVDVERKVNRTLPDFAQYDD